MTNPAEDRTPRYHVVMIRFNGPEKATELLERLKVERAFDGCEIEGLSVVSRDIEGHIHVHEKGGAGIGAAFGTAAMGVLGWVTGPVFLPIMLVVGAVAGGVAGHFAGQAIPSGDLRRVAESLTPGTSAFLAVVDTRHARNVIDAFGEEGELVIDTTLETELSNAIREAVLHDVRRV